MEKVVLQWLVEQARNKPDNIAIIYKGHSITYEQVLKKAKEVASWLQDKKIEPGDRVVICLKNSDQFVYILFGILINRSCFVPVNSKIDKKQFCYILKNCTPSCIIMDSDNPLHQITDEFSNLVIEYSQNCYQDVEVDACMDNLDLYREDDLAAIVYTSGTSKYPKGVVEHNRQIVFAVHAINQVIGNQENDRILCGLPLSFDYGLYQIFLAFEVGASIVLEEDFSICSNIVKLIYEYKVTGFPGVPTLFNLLIMSRAFELVELPSLRYLTSTGDVFSVNTITKLIQLLPNTTVYPMYGLTECKRVSIMPGGFDQTRPTAVGKPLPGVNVKIVNEANQEVPCGETGQLVIQGPNVMSGYWNNFEDTVIKYRYDEAQNQILLYTGDSFYMDQEGYLFYAGRRENFIKSRGFKVSPIEVEHALCSIDGVTQAAVFGIPDVTKGESVYAVVQTARRMDKSFILNSCKERLQNEKIPDKIEITIRELPKTANGKIDHKSLRKKVLGEI